ncbi:NAD(P)-dependent dehydrogenase (short-subunit alcohol dehydrogenase family) [Nakamurella sp. UYEF19]|uniref:SDR family oxidoreductase n=1 Tax=Nakamurella sp. UYEF19 TaxID=1756392 RepID=UPI003397B2B6
MIATLEAGSVAVLTGGARGIGLAIAGVLAAEGVNLACLDQPLADYSAFETLCRAAGVGHRVLPVDVRDREAVFAAVGAASAVGPVRYAVNCAGIDMAGDSATTTADDWNKVMEVDLDGLFYSCQAEYESIRANGGAIVNIASMSGHIINRGLAHAAYCTAKAGVIHLTKALGVEWAAGGVRVNSVSPGYTSTEMTVNNPLELNAMFAEQTPIGRMASVEEIARPVAFLLSSAAAYITATDLTVDGGFTAW